MFDADRETTLTGVVRAFQWTNPHARLQLAVTRPDGQTQDWSIEAVSPDVLRRKGWNRDALKPGDLVVAIVNPARDGRRAGGLVHVEGADGRKIGKVW